MEMDRISKAFYAIGKRIECGVIDSAVVGMSREEIMRIVEDYNEDGDSNGQLSE